MSKLETLGLIERRAGGRDQRVREAVTTKAGREMVAAIGGARRKVFTELMAGWSSKDQCELARLVHKLADEMVNQKL